MASRSGVSAHRWTIRFLLSFMVGCLFAVAPLHAQTPMRSPKCPACANEANVVAALATLIDSKLRPDLTNAKNRYVAAAAANNQADRNSTQAIAGATEAQRLGLLIDPAALDRATAELKAAGEALKAATDALMKASQALGQAQTQHREAMKKLDACEAKNCAAPPPPPTITYIHMAEEGTLALLKRQAACRECQGLADQRNAVVEEFNQISIEIAQKEAEHDEVAKRRTAINAQIYSHGATVRAWGGKAPPALQRALDERTAALRNEYLMVKWRDEALPVERRLLREARDEIRERYRLANGLLILCEQQICRRPAIGIAPAGGVTPLVSPPPTQTATPPGQTPPTGTTPGPQSPLPPSPPPPSTTGDTRQSRAEVQVFGGFAYGVSKLNLTGVDNFFGPGAELFDRRSSSAPQGVNPALGFMARFYIDPPGEDPGVREAARQLRRSRFFAAFGVLFTPGRGTPGFEATGVNTVPAGDVRSETSRTFVAPIMAGYQVPLTIGTTPVDLDFMAGVAISHETVRVVLRREGGAPGGPGGIAESRGLNVDPVLGLALSAPIGDIAGLGPVRAGVMGLAVIGTGARSATIRSANFGSQSYTVEHRRAVDFFLGATLAVGFR